MRELKIQPVVTYDPEGKKPTQLRIEYPKAQGTLDTKMSTTILIQATALCIKTYLNSSTTELTIEDLRNEVVDQLDNLLYSSSYDDARLHHIDTKKS